MSLSIGSRLGAYEILSPLGAGGIGEVYRVHDTKLGSDVALKILPAAFALDAERVGRFKREAQVPAALNDEHRRDLRPQETNGGQARVLELVERPTLGACSFLCSVRL
jgi:eukaryotic-like serine/threonine-protein kinase